MKRLEADIVAKDLCQIPKEGKCFVQAVTSLR